MNDRLHIADTDLTLHAMGALSPAETAAVEAHLKDCAQCKEEVRQNLLALASYAQTTPEAAVPAGSKDRFLSRVARTAQETPAAAIKPAVDKPKDRVSLWQKIFGSGGGWTPVLAGAMAVALVFVGIDDYRMHSESYAMGVRAGKGAAASAQLNELMELLTSPKAKRVALHPGPVTAPPPEGRVVYAERTGKLLLTASNLKPLPEGKTYELWILQPGGKAPLPAGTFAPDASGNATMILADAPAGLAVQGFGVTIENAGGSEKPTLPIVLSGM